MTKENWTKEEIMSLADGELSHKEELRLKKIIETDANARLIYEKFSMADDLLDITYKQLEESFNTKKTSSHAKQEDIKIDNPKGFGAISISIGNLVTGSLILVAIVAFAGYQLGLNNMQKSSQSERYYELYVMNNVLNNQGILKKHVFSNSTKDLNIKIEDNRKMLLKVVDREIKNNNFCQRYGLEFQNRNFIVEACNVNLENNEWSYTLKSKSLD